MVGPLLPTPGIIGSVRVGTRAGRDRNLGGERLARREPPIVHGSTPPDLGRSPSYPGGPEPLPASTNFYLHRTRVLIIWVTEDPLHPMDSRSDPAPMTEADLEPVCRCPANERRRTVIAALQAPEDGTASLDDLLDHVIERASAAPPPDSETVSVELYHRHLPKLADHGVRAVDERTETVSYGPSPAIERAVHAE